MEKKEVINEINQEIFPGLEELFSYWNGPPNSQSTGWLKVEIMPKHNDIRINTVEYYPARNKPLMHEQHQWISRTYWTKKLDTKQYILYDAIYMKFKNR